jgi:hypothetical protein
MAPDDEPRIGDQPAPVDEAMTSLEAEVRDVATPPETAPRETTPLRARIQRVSDEVEATPIVGAAYDWIRAVALGVKDTAQVMLDEGRKGAHAAESEAWRRFDAKTKYRRKPRQ